MMAWLIALSVLYVGLLIAFMVHANLVGEELHWLRNKLSELDIDKEAKRVFDKEIKAWWEGHWSHTSFGYIKGERGKLLEEVSTSITSLTKRQEMLADLLGYEWKYEPGTNTYVKKKRAAVR